MYFKSILVSIVSTIVTFFMVTFLFFYSSSTSIGEKINFQTKNGGFKFTTIPSKGRDYLMMERKFDEYKSVNHIEEELVLYRTTRKNYFKISKWCQYKLMPEWQYPLLN